MSARVRENLLTIIVFVLDHETLKLYICINQNNVYYVMKSEISSVVKALQVFHALSLGSRNPGAPLDFLIVRCTEVDSGRQRSQ